MRKKHPWSTKSDASTILFLPGFERGFFYRDGSPSLGNTMRQMSMQALAMSSQFAFGIGVLSPGRFVPLALFPVQATFFDATLLIIIVGIIDSSLSVHLAL